MSSSVELRQFTQVAEKAYPSTHLVFGEEGQLEARGALESLWVHYVRSVDVKEENRKAWRAFQRCMEDAIGPARVERICQKYSLQRPDECAALGQPLLARQVELFSVGATDLRITDLERPQGRTPGEIDRLVRERSSFPLLGPKMSPVKVGGTPMRLSAWFMHDPLLMDREKYCLLSDVETLSEKAYFERLAKAVVNRELPEGALLPAPTGNGGRDYYYVFKKISGEGLVAYALMPVSNTSQLKPLLLFRPSQLAPSHEDAWQTYLNDLQLNVGEMGYEATKGSLSELMRSAFGSSPGGVVVLGYSLGGTFAQRFVRDNWRGVSQLICYADPSVDDACAEAFAAEVNAQGRLARRLQVQIYRTADDLAHRVGGKHVGWGITHPDVHVYLHEWVHPLGKALPLLSRHAERLFDIGELPPKEDITLYQGEALNAQLDNKARGEEIFWCEKFRLVWGAGIIYACVSLIERILSVLSRFFGIPFLRRVTSAEAS